ncbi:HIRAN domain-containing protein [Corynebacterium propinquum]|uniref:HIRAN domain-containing protein n=1 Tax=Corynebacterium propinquum TaxID=43769 RepID=UPI001EF32C1C|nr:HIRAN domain-containing protein [Corynebacterium propinquum]MCG7231082.1 HIRAN domain-containing protein [Corynebacterium propinquum]WKS49528.1 HIRAN domain-containing protein [Corynebacterium propinquum]
MPNYHQMRPSKTPTVAAVGEFAYSDALDKLPAGNCLVELIPEPDNPYDDRAISIRHHDDVIGYIPRHQTGQYWGSVCRIIASGKTPQARALIQRVELDDTAEVFLYLLPGDSGIGSESGLIAKADEYSVPDAYKEPIQKSGPGASIAQRHIDRRPRTPAEESRLNQVQKRNSDYDRDWIHRVTGSASEQNLDVIPEDHHSRSNNKPELIGCGVLVAVAVLVLILVF